MRTLTSLPLSEIHAEFLSLFPAIVRHARFAFRHRNAVDREEAEAEAVAAAFESFVGLKLRGKDPARDFPTLIGTFAVLHVKDGGHVGGHSSSKDALSAKAQAVHGFRVESLPAYQQASFGSVYADPGGQRAQDLFEERLRDNNRTPVADQVCFRVDFPAFLQRLTSRDRRLASYLSLGHSARAASRLFKLGPARITQLRKRWQEEWLNFQGEKSR
jgi:hypothetical protein